MKRKTVNIRGLVTPARWDETGRPVRISLSTFNEDVYLIDDDVKGRDLLNFIREEIEIKGEVSHVKGIKTIRVNRFFKTAVIQNDS